MTMQGAANPAMLFLASTSPRRLQLLISAGYRPVCLPAEASAIDETLQADETGERAVCRLAEAKARQALTWQELPNNAVVLAGDTVVVRDGEILGKPCDQADATAMLQRLAGQRHQVLTAISVGYKSGQGGDEGVPLRTACVRTDVWLLPLSAAQIAAYLATGEPLDKAGSYAIQGLAAQFVARIEGSCSGVAGLPLAETHTLLAEFGIVPDWLRDTEAG